MQDRFYLGLIPPDSFRQFQEGIWAAYTVNIYFACGRLFFVIFYLNIFGKLPLPQLFFFLHSNESVSVFVKRHLFKKKILILGQFISSAWADTQASASSPPLPCPRFCTGRKHQQFSDLMFRSDDGEISNPAYGMEVCRKNQLRSKQGHLSPTETWSKTSVGFSRTDASHRLVVCLLQKARKLQIFPF